VHGRRVSLSTGCTILSCASSPVQTGYSISIGASTIGSTRTVVCAAGYFAVDVEGDERFPGTVSSITCQVRLFDSVFGPVQVGEWSLSSGCSTFPANRCSLPPVQTGYEIADGPNFAMASNPTKVLFTVYDYPDQTSTFSCTTSMRFTDTATCYVVPKLKNKVIVSQSSFFAPRVVTLFDGSMTWSQHMIAGYRSTRWEASALYISRPEEFFPDPDKTFSYGSAFQFTIGLISGATVMSEKINIMIQYRKPTDTSANLNWAFVSQYREELVILAEPDSTSVIDCFESEIVVNAPLNCRFFPRRNNIPIYALYDSIGTFSASADMISGTLDPSFDEAWLDQKKWIPNWDATVVKVVPAAGKEGANMFLFTVQTSHAFTYFDVTSSISSSSFSLTSKPKAELTSFAADNFYLDPDYLPSVETAGRILPEGQTWSVPSEFANVDDFVQVSCSVLVCLGLSAHGTVYSWGHIEPAENAQNCFGRVEGQGWAIPGLVTYIEKIRTVGIYTADITSSKSSPAVGCFHYLLSDAGELWQWGNSSKLYLFVTSNSKSEDYATTNAPKPDTDYVVDATLTSSPVTLLVSKGPIGLFATASGEVYSWVGNCAVDFVTYGHTSDNCKPIQLSMLSSQGTVTSIMCSAEYCFVLRDYGRQVFTWGFGLHNTPYYSPGSLISTYSASRPAHFHFVLEKR